MEYGGWPILVRVTEEDMCYGNVKNRKQFQPTWDCLAQTVIGLGRGVFSVTALGGVAEAGRAEYRAPSG